MSDTTPEVAQHYCELLLARSPVERLMMSARMFDTARALILASFPLDLSSDERQRRLFYETIRPRHATCVGARETQAALMRLAL